MTEAEIRDVNNWIADLKKLPCFTAPGSFAGMVEESTLDEWRRAGGTVLLLHWYKAGATEQPGIDVATWKHFLWVGLQGRPHMNGQFARCDGELAELDPLEDLEAAVALAEVARQEERAYLGNYRQLTHSLPYREQAWAEGSAALQLRLKNRAAGLPDAAIPFVQVPPTAEEQLAVKAAVNALRRQYEPS